MADGTSTDDSRLRLAKLLNNAEGIEVNDPNYGDLLKNLQCNILSSHGKPCAHYFFVRFSQPDPTPTVRLLGLLAMTPRHRSECLEREPGLGSKYPEFFSGGALEAVRVASEFDVKTWREWSHEEQKTTQGGPAPVEVAVTVMLSGKGYGALPLPEPAADPFEAAFTAGMAQRGDRLNDIARTEWDPGYRDRDIHALVVVAFNPGAVANHADMIEVLDDLLRRSGEIVCQESGAALSSRAKDPRTGKVWTIEPFGFRDDISQPLYYESDLRFHKQKLEGESATTTGGEWRSFEPLRTVLRPDPYGQTPDACGTYFVFRKLRQDIAKFYRQAKTMAGKFPAPGGATRPEGDVQAELVGRRHDGTPLVLPPPLLPSKCPSLNDFNYDSAENKGMCPRFAHSRKVNRRGPPYNPHQHRIVRRGLPYGPEIKRTVDGVPDLDADGNVRFRPGQQGEIGLLFLCAQSNIEEGFEHVQGWANEADGGVDPIGGQAKGEHLIGHRDPTGELRGLLPYDPPVDLLGGEYFFAPSLSFLMTLALIRTHS